MSIWGKKAGSEREIKLFRIQKPEYITGSPWEYSSMAMIPSKKIPSVKRRDDIVEEAEKPGMV